MACPQKIIFKEDNKMNNLQNVHNLLLQNGYKGSYEDFKKEDLSKLSDEDLECISGGANNSKIDKILASMLAVLSLSGCMTSLNYASAMRDIHDLNQYQNINEYIDRLLFSSKKKLFNC